MLDKLPESGKDKPGFTKEELASRLTEAFEPLEGTAGQFGKRWDAGKQIFSHKAFGEAKNQLKNNPAIDIDRLRQEVFTESLSKSAFLSAGIVVANAKHWSEEALRPNNHTKKSDDTGKEGMASADADTEGIEPLQYAGLSEGQKTMVDKAIKGLEVLACSRQLRDMENIGEMIIGILHSAPLSHENRAKMIRSLDNLLLSSDEGNVEGKMSEEKQKERDERFIYFKHDLLNRILKTLKPEMIITPRTFDVSVNVNSETGDIEISEHPSTKVESKELLKAESRLFATISSMPFTSFEDFMDYKTEGHEETIEKLKKLYNLLTTLKKIRDAAKNSDMLDKSSSLSANEADVPKHSIAILSGKIDRLETLIREKAAPFVTENKKQRGKAVGERDSSIKNDAA